MLNVAATKTAEKRWIAKCRKCGHMHGTTKRRTALTELCSLSNLLLAIDEAERGSGTVGAEHSRFLSRLVERADSKEQDQ